MRVATADGGYETIRERSWPLAGLDFPRSITNANDSVTLANLPGGGANAATYQRIYRTNPWVFAACQAISRGVSRFPINVYSFDSKGARERVRSDLPGQKPSNGTKLDKLMRIPEPGVGRQEWLRKIVLNLGIYGNALANKDYDGSGSSSVPSALWHIPWKRVHVQEGDNVPVLYYEVKSRMGMSESKKFSPLDVIHFGRGTDDDSPIGLSPLATLKATLALHDALWRHAVAYFQNSARPSGLVKLEKGAGEAIIRTIKEQIEALYTNPENAGKVLVTSGEWTSMTDSPDHSQLVELARLSREEISAAYGIPQPMMGILDRAILNNTQELRSYFTRDVLGEKSSALEDDFMAQLVYATPAWVGFFTSFDLTGSLKPDMEKLGDLVQKTRSALTPNEQRDMFFGLNPLDMEEANTVWMPSGQIGLGIEPPAPEVPKGTKPVPTEPVEGDAEPPDPEKDPPTPAE